MEGEQAFDNGQLRANIGGNTKIALVYYSFSGNTHNAVLFLRQRLESKGNEVQTIRLKLAKEESSFFKQGRDAFLKKEAALTSCEYNLEKYDFVIFATPVWAFTITPALRSYLNKAEGLKNKKAGFVLTYGSGVGVNKTKRELKQILHNKGALVEFMLGLQGSKTKDKEYLKSKFSSLSTTYDL